MLLNVFSAALLDSAIFQDLPTPMLFIVTNLNAVKWEAPLETCNFLDFPHFSFPNKKYLVIVVKVLNVHPKSVVCL